ncbi:MAG: class I SAM-dependent methyltransferase [Promethearchaeota archaeon]
MVPVESYYDRMYLKEARRLRRDPYHQLEFIITMHHLKKFLPKKGYVLDLGCGPGVYAVELAKLGYDVALVDVSSKLLNVAERRIKKAKLQDRLKTKIKANATDLSSFGASTFDAILSFGPFYHLPELKDRKKALKEMVRVAKLGARVFVACVSYFAVLGRVLTRHGHELTDPNHQEMFEEGIHRAKWHKDPNAFPDAYFSKPLELRDFLESGGLRTIGLFACEGPSTHLDEETNRLSKDKKAWEKWVELVLKCSGEPSIVGASEHFLWIGEKPQTG